MFYIFFLPPAHHRKCSVDTCMILLKLIAVLWPLEVETDIPFEGAVQNIIFHIGKYKPISTLKEYSYEV